MSRPPTPAARRLAFGVVLIAAGLVAGVRLGMPSWHMDELIYRDAGIAYLHGDFTAAREHPPLAQYLYGAAALLGGSRPGAVRVPAALASIGTGVVLFVFGRQIAGFWAGLAAFAVFSLLPCTGWSGPGRLTIRIDRFALLDPIMGFLLTLALWLGWRWRGAGGVARAVVTGLAVGLAATAKVPGLLVAPVILIAVLLRRGRRAGPECLAFVTAAVASAALVYAPFGRTAPDAIRYMLAFQGAHRTNGHPAIVADTFYLHPPWWTMLWWYWRGSGTATVGGVAGAVAASFVVVMADVRRYLLASIAVLFAFVAWVAGVALPHYLYDWQPPLALLVGLALVGLWRRGGPARAVGIGLTALLAVGVATTALRLSRVTPADYRLAGRTLAASGFGRGTVVALGFENVVRAYLPHATVVSLGPLPDEVDVILLDPLWASRFDSPAAAALLRANLPALAECRFDRLHVYVRTVPPHTTLATRCTRPATLPPPTPGSPTGF